MSQNVADFLLSRLREWGVRQVFGFPGDGINGLLAAWGGDAIRVRGDAGRLLRKTHVR